MDGTKTQLVALVASATVLSLLILRRVKRGMASKAVSTLSVLLLAAGICAIAFLRDGYFATDLKDYGAYCLLASCIWLVHELYPNATLPSPNCGIHREGRVNRHGNVSGDKPGLAHRAKNVLVRAMKKGKRAVETPFEGIEHRDTDLQGNGPVLSPRSGRKSSSQDSKDEKEDLHNTGFLKDEIEDGYCSRWSKKLREFVQCALGVITKPLPPSCSCPDVDGCSCAPPALKCPNGLGGKVRARELVNKMDNSFDLISTSSTTQPITCPTCTLCTPSGACAEQPCCESILSKMKSLFTRPTCEVCGGCQSDDSGAGKGRRHGWFVSMSLRVSFNEVVCGLIICGAAIIVGLIKAF